jgi:cation diffusion facilitator family transporter
LPKKIILISILASLITIGLKLSAAYVSNSVGIFSDALESFINLIASCVAYMALSLAERPADKKHTYGYNKVEYFASGLEGGLILVASGGIFYAAFKRFLHPQELNSLDWGVFLVLLSAVVNAIVAWILLRGARRYNSIVLEADAKHLLTDVITTLGVSLGVGIVYFWPQLKVVDPLLALLVALQILRTGYELTQKSFWGLLDRALPQEEQEQIEKIVKNHSVELTLHNLRTRKSGKKRFIDFHLLLDGKTSVQQAHDICCELEEEIRKAFPESETTIHVEPIEDKRSWKDDFLRQAEKNKK